MPKSSDGCLQRPGQKTAGVTLYLMEELGDARLRCDQLVRYLDEAVKLIEKSSHKDHFFEVAGHLIQSVPDTAFKLQKALQAVALAADRLDYEELKQELRPEKVEELERVLKEVRIRPVQHRSEPGAIPMTPQKAAQRLREIAKTAREEGMLPLHDIAAFVRDLTPARKANDSLSSAETLEKMAETLEGTEKVGRAQLAALLSRIAMEAEFNTAFKLASKPRLTQEMLQLGDVEEVKQKFKSENPDISDEDLNEIAKQWQTNKDVVKDKTALVEDPTLVPHFDTIRTLSVGALRAASSSRWRPALVNLMYIVDEIGTVLVRLGSMDTLKSEALKREIRQAIPQAARAIEEGAGDPSVVMASEWKAAFGAEDHHSKFEEGKPADPTENLSPEDAKRWKEEHDKHKDNFKAAAVKWVEKDDSKGKSWQTDASGDTFDAAQIHEIKGPGIPLYVLKFTLKDGSAIQQKKEFKKLDEAKKAAETWMKSDADKASLILTDFKKLADTADEARRSRFEEGKPADPTENLNPGDAKEWKEQHDKHKDNFKAGSGRTTHLEGKKGHTLCGEQAYPDTVVDSVKDATCPYCKQSWQKSHGGLTASDAWKA